MRGPAYLGVDNGLDGALALLGPAGEIIDLVRMPCLALSRNGKLKRELDMMQLRDLIDGWFPITAAAIELATPIRHKAKPCPAGGGEGGEQGPPQGLASTGAFMRNFGRLEGLLSMSFTPMPFPPVAPVTWQRAVGLKAKGGKDAATALAQRTWPEHTKALRHSGCADAALIALWLHGKVAGARA